MLSWQLSTTGWNISYEKRQTHRQTQYWMEPCIRWVGSTATIIMMMMSVPRNRPPVFIFMVIVFSALMITFVISRCNQEVQNQEHNYNFHHDHIGCQLRPYLLNCMHTWKGIKWWVSWIVNRCMQFVCLYIRCHFLDDLNTTQSSNKWNLWWFFF